MLAVCNMMSSKWQNYPPKFKLYVFTNAAKNDEYACLKAYRVSEANKSRCRKEK